MSSDSEGVDDMRAEHFTGESIVSRLFYSKKKRKTLQPLTRPMDPVVPPVNIIDEESYFSDISDISVDDSVIDPDYIPGNTTITDIDEPVAGPSGVQCIKKTPQVVEPHRDSDTDVERESDGELPSLSGDSVREGASAIVPEEVSHVGDVGGGEHGVSGGAGVSGDTEHDGERDGEGRPVAGLQGRKRPRNPEGTKRAVAKMKRSLGEQYVSAYTAKMMEKRKMGNPCADGCFTKLGEDVLKEIFEAYWKIGDLSVQNAYLVSLIRTVEIKRKRTKQNVSSRQCNYHYSVKHSGKEHHVCRAAFLSIHGIRSGKLHYLLKEKVSSTGTIIPDKRGKSTPPNKISENTVNRVHEHIKLLPVTQSHYTRAKSHRRVYLPTASSIPRLYVKYNEFMMELYPGEPKVTEHFYRDVFTKQYNIGIAPPVVVRAHEEDQVDSDSDTECTTMDYVYDDA